MSTITPISPAPMFQKNIQALSDDSPEGRAQQRAQAAERDANTRVVQAEHQVVDAERDENTQIEKVREDSHRASESESDRQSKAIQAQKQKGYERLRDLQRAQAQELAHAKRDGDKQLFTTEIQGKDAIHATSQREKKELVELEKNNMKQVGYEKQSAKKTIDDLQFTQNQRTANLKEDSEAKFTALNAARTQEYEKLRENSTAGTEKTRADFETKYQNKLSEQNTNLSDLEGRATHQLNEIRADTAEKLSAYSSRQKDPFYKMKEVDAKIYDAGENFMLVATVPEHEQQHISVTVRGNQLALTGYRRNEEKMDIAPGRAKSTSSYQSFSENFPLNAPVDAKLLSKSFEGDQLIVTVPKKPEFMEVPIFDKKTPDKVKVERPQFPENLPLGKYQAKNNIKDETVEKSDKLENSSETKSSASSKGAGPLL